MTIQKSKIGLLSFPGSPLTYPTIVELQKLGYEKFAVIFDGTHLNKRLTEIIHKRTQGKAEFHTYEQIRKLGAPIYFVSNHNNPETLELIKREEMQILASCGTPRKLHRDILETVPFGIVNCHPGKLPQYRGSSSVEWSLQNGDEVGATAHFMAEDYDAGPIIEFYPLAIQGLSYSEIRLKMIAHQARCLADAVHKVLSSQRRPADYPPQTEGRIWPVYPEADFEQLMKRSF